MLKSLRRLYESGLYVVFMWGRIGYTHDNIINMRSLDIKKDFHQILSQIHNLLPVFYQINAKYRTQFCLILFIIFSSLQDLSVVQK